MSFYLRKPQERLSSLIPISGEGAWSTTRSTTAGSSGVRGSALIGDFRIVTVLPVSSVTDDLHTTIGQSDTVLATDHVTVAGSLMRVLVGGLGVVHSVVEVEGHAWLMDVLKEEGGGKESRINTR